MIEPRYIIISILLLCSMIILLIGVFKGLKEYIIGGILSLFGSLIILIAILIYTSNNRKSIENPIIQPILSQSFNIINPLSIP